MMKLIAWLTLLLLPIWQSYAYAQNSAPRLSSPGQVWNEWRARAPVQNVPVTPELLDAQRATQQRQDALKDARARGVASARGGINAATGAIAKGLGEADKADDTLRAIEEGANAGGYTGTANAIRAAREAAREALERIGLVDPSDRDYTPRAAPDGQPDVPSSCDGNPACQECFGTALDKLEDTRLRLERLRAVYASTMTDVKARISFADGASAVHGVSALAWQKYKLDVMRSLKGLDRAYDNKYAELMTALLNDLKGIGVCEANMMKVPDWYDRYGYIYYTFMKSAYSRPAL
jgi:hypothetical protein